MNREITVHTVFIEHKKTHRNVSTAVYLQNVAIMKSPLLKHKRALLVNRSSRSDAKGLHKRNLLQSGRSKF